MRTLDYGIGLLRTLQFTIAAALRVSALFWTAPQIKAADASVTQREQIIGTIIFAGAYLAISALAILDLRASSLVGSIVAFITTPLYALLWLFSQWTPQSSKGAIPLLWGIGGNIGLFVFGIVAFILATARCRRSARTAMIPK